MYNRSDLSLDIFHVSFLIRYFIIHNPSSHLVGWLSGVSLFLMFVKYQNYLFFFAVTSYSYSFNILLLSDVLLKTVKTYQPRNPWYILLVEVPHGFTLACNQRQGINHSSPMLLILRHFPPLFRVHFICLSIILLVNIYISVEENK